MIYNKKIVLEILRSEFGKGIEAFVNMRVMDLGEKELKGVLGEAADYAVLDGINEMQVGYYEVKKENTKGDGGRISGELSVLAEINAYIYHDSGDLYVGSGEIEFGISFAFDEELYENLELEYLY